jgi:5-methyltetrahydrofolate--homocysteine methyltransferase
VERRSGLQAAGAGQLGVQSFDIDLAELVDYIDWGPFFQTWDLAGSYPKILTTRSSARPPAEVRRRSDAGPHGRRAGHNPWIKARAVFGLFPANAVGDDIEIYADESRSRC